MRPIRARRATRSREKLAYPASVSPLGWRRNRRRRDRGPAVWDGRWLRLVRPRAAMGGHSARRDRCRSYPGLGVRVVALRPGVCPRLTARRLGRAHLLLVRRDAGARMRHPAPPGRAGGGAGVAVLPLMPDGW